MLIAGVAWFPKEPRWSGPSGLAWPSARTHWDYASGRTAGTALVSAAKPGFWELDVKLDLPGLDFEGLYV